MAIRAPRAPSGSLAGVILAVTLDFWNTLFIDRRGRERERLRADVLRAELAALGKAPPEHRVLDSLAHGFDYFEQVWRREQRTPDCAEILDATLDQLGEALPADARRRVTQIFAEVLLQAPPDVVPGAARTVAYLGATYRLALVCDTGYSPGRVLRRLLDDAGMLEHFDYLYFSDEGGRSKPDPEVFRGVLERLGVRAAEAVHVGDMQRTDIAGAQGAGMWAIHFLGANDRDAAGSTADAVTRRFEEVPRLIGDLMCPGCGLSIDGLR
jgi:putative hydrolase of the HAD superfamily